MITDADIKKLKKTFVTTETFNNAIDRVIEYINASTESILSELRSSDQTHRLDNHEIRILELENQTSL